MLFPLLKIENGVSTIMFFVFFLLQVKYAANVHSYLPFSHTLNINCMNTVSVFSVQNKGFLHAQMHVNFALCM